MGWWNLYLALFAAGALLFNVKPVYSALYFMAMLHFGMKHMLLHALSRIQLTRYTDRTSLFRGETVNINLKVENPTLAPIAWLSGYEHIPVPLSAGRPKRWVLSLPPRGQCPVTYSVVGRERGVYTVGPVDIALGDPFGIHTVTGRVDVCHKVVVYPTVFDLHALGLPSELPFGNVRSRRRIYPDPSRLAGVRPYERGDTLRSIHWRATARTGSLQVKLLEHTITLDTTLFLNMNSLDYQVSSLDVDSELAVETAASLANHLAKLGESFSFVTNGQMMKPKFALDRPDTISPSSPDRGSAPETVDEGAGNTPKAVYRLTSQKGMPQLMKVLEALASVACRPTTSFSALLRRETGNLAWGSTVLIIVPADDEEVVESAVSLTKSGCRVVIFVTGKRVIHTQLLAQPEHSPLQVYRVRRDSTLHVDKEA